MHASVDVTIKPGNGLGNDCGQYNTSAHAFGEAVPTPKVLPKV